MTTRSQQKRQVIIETAKSLFLNQGFSQTSMDQIAHVAQVSKKTVYHHFADKMELFKTMVEEHWQLVLKNEVSMFDAKLPQAENLKNFARSFLDFLGLKQTVDLFRLLIAESQQFPELTKALTANNHGPFTRQLIIYLTEQAKKGKLEITNIELAAYQFLGLIKEYHFWIRLFGLNKKLKKSEVEESIEHSVNMFLSYYCKN